MSERRDEDREIWAAIDTLSEQMEVVMGATDSISQALSTLAADTSAALGDIKAQVQTLESEVTDPTKVQAIVDQINSLDSQVKTADPGATAPTPTTPATPVVSPAPAASDTSAAAPVTDASSTPAPAPDPSAAPAAPAAAADAPVAPVDAPAPAPAEPAKSVYTFTGDPSLIDPAAWPASGFETAEATPRLLYYFSGDGAPGQTAGNGLSGGAWQVYTGSTQPVPAAA